MNNQQWLNKVVHKFFYRLFLALTVSGVILVSYLVNSSTQHEQQQKQLLLKNWLTTSIGEAVYRYDLQSIKALVDQAIINDWLVGVSVRNERDITLIQISTEPNRSASITSAQQPPKIKTEILDLSYHGQRVGFIHFVIAPISLPINQLLLLQTIAIIISLTFLLSLIVRRFVTAKITHPIKKLTNAVSNNDAVKLEALSMKQDIPYEIGHLATEFLNSHKKLISEATEDFLTGLPNRRAFESKLQFLLSNHTDFVLGMIDVDNFKQVNDTFGHDAGDILLISCAKVLHETMTANGYVARLGGDEFAFILERSAINKAAKIATDIIQGIQNISKELPDKNINISASIGLAGPLQQVSPQDALRFADIALYKSKTAGRARYTIYHPSFEEQPKRWIEVQSALSQALSIGHLNYELEPINYLRSKRTYGVEMLLRVKA